jgi:uncharacterized protein YeaC (DUF1315 family)
MTTRSNRQTHIASERSSRTTRISTVESSRHARDPRLNQYRNVRYYQKKRKQTKHKKRIILGIVCSLLCLIFVWGGYLGVTAFNMKNSTDSIIKTSDKLQDSLVNSKTENLDTYAENLKDSTSYISSTLNSPGWNAVKFVPFIGSDVKKISDLMSNVDDMTANALVPFLSTIKQNPIDGIVSKGNIDIPKLTILTNAVVDYLPVIQNTLDNASKIDGFNLPWLNSMFDKVKGKISTSNATVDFFEAVAPFLPKLFGSEGQRNYLVIAQNSAEIRSTGGYVGSAGLLTFNSGKMELGEFQGGRDFLGGSLPNGCNITDKEQNLFMFTNDCADIGYDPDFVRCASIWVKGYEQSHNQHIDGVLSLTPEIIQKLISITGNIKLTDGTVLTKDNATKTLQHDLYWNYLSRSSSINISYGNKITDALFGEAAQLTFNKLMNSMNLKNLFKFTDIFMNAMQSRVAQFCLSDTSEQANIEKLNCSGAISGSGNNNTLGVFASMKSGNKLGWYLDIQTEIKSKQDNGDNVSYEVVTKFTNTVSQEEVYSGGTYIIGFEDQYGDMFPYLCFTAPNNGSITNINTSDESYKKLEHFNYRGADLVDVVQPSLKPGSSYTVSYTVNVPKDTITDNQDLIIKTTPTLTQYR